MRRAAFALVLGVAAVLVALRLAAPLGSGSGLAPPCHDTDVLTSIEVPTLRTASRQLVLRQSGLQEKEHFFELHTAGTSFDDCRRASRTAIDIVHVDRTQGVPASIAVAGDRLTLVYQPAATSVARPLAETPVRVAPP